MGYQKDEHDTKFYRAIRKYGKENFKIEVNDDIADAIALGYAYINQ